MRKSAWLRGVVIAATAFAARDAEAEGRARLSVERRGTDCVEDAALRTAVARRLGYDPFVPDAPKIASVIVAREGAALVGSVRLIEVGRADTAPRSLRADRCEDLLEALALTVSVAIDPAVALIRPAVVPPVLPPPSRPRPVDPPLPRTHPEAPTAPAPPTAPVEAQSAQPPGSAPRSSHETAHEVAPLSAPTRWQLAVGLGATGSTGDTPSLSLGGFGYARASRGLFGAELDLRAVAPGTTATALGTVSAWSAAIDVAPCVLPSILEVCALGEAALLDAVGEVTSPRHDVGIVGRVGGRLGLIVPSGRFEGRIEGDVLANPAPATVAVAGRDVYRYAPATVRLGVGAGVRF